ncbi:MAG: hypothetical protein A2Y62_02225 [Candidatus Fischerbacteria bacterium RBG_13_37_8]|uniref:HNH nuclease domain-containing protein n=1 Tax=Candidatus Fischerbacteria bacterium RBG_13_37_8 TaxID=1817863 RepID=A0A1F5VJP1_9BACT|nr:MAG: hypothetical protein A2Y62_02225 [Candidatus Fischerbacteria bacterium RBG_13_37_8]
MTDMPIRHAAFNWLNDQVSRKGDVLPRKLLSEGFIYNGNKIRLVGPQGIFKPKLCQLPLSITTSPNSPYKDTIQNNKILLYKYRGTDPQHRDNIGLRHAMKQKVPLIYFFGIVESKYLAMWPAFIMDDDSTNLTFYVQVDEFGLLSKVSEEETPIRRAYITSQAMVRLHQRTFREKVLIAYQTQCAFCRLKHEELLDAAHIIPDSQPEGEPHVSNGLALCKLHHAAFDSHFIGVKMDYIMEVRRDILEEPDGPMHELALRDMHGKRIILPRERNLWPNHVLLEKRYEQFRRAV